MASDTLDDLMLRIRHFAEERDWNQFHSPKNLSTALMVEAAELAEHFQWLSQKQSLELHAEQQEAVALEMADVLIYLVRMADRLDIDLLQAARRKIVLNAEKYPVSKSYGRADRPTE